MNKDTPVIPLCKQWLAAYATKQHMLIIPLEQNLEIT